MDNWVAKPRTSIVLLALVGLVILVLGIVMALLPFVFGAPALFVESNIVDFGDVPDHSHLVKELRVANHGRKILELRAAKTNCNCTQVHLSKGRLDPGESAVLRITLASNTPSREKTPGTIEIALLSNDPVIPVQRILVKYGPRGAAWLEPSLLDYGRIDREELPLALTCRLKVDNLKPTSSGPLDVSLSVTEPWIHIERSEPVKQGGQTLTLTLSKDTPSGEILSRLNVSVGGPGTATSFQASVIGYVRGRLFARPKMLTLRARSDDGAIEPELVALRDHEEPEASVMVESATFSETLSRFLCARVDQDGHTSCVRIVANSATIGADLSRQELCGYLTIVGIGETGYREQVNVPAVLFLAGAKVQ